MGSKEVSGGDGDHAHGKELGGTEGLAAIFLSTRFWIFALLGFGLSGTLLHVFNLAAAPLVAGIAIGSGLAAGLFAVFVFRAVVRASSATVAAASGAVGKTGKVLV